MNLLFKNPVLHPGLNVTVRNGPKWLGPSPGTVLSIVDTYSGAHVRAAVVVSAERYESVEDIPSFLLAFEHDQECRNTEGLVTAMDRAYGKNSWGEAGLTVLLFWV